MTARIETQQDKGPKTLNKSQIKTAANALLKHVSKKKEDALFLDAPTRFLLDITAFEAPSGVVTLVLRRGVLFHKYGVACFEEFLYGFHILSLIPVSSVAPTKSQSQFDNYNFLSGLSQIMADYSQYGGILNQLANNPAPPLLNLATIWEWNDLTGDPIFQDPQQRWKRFVPNSMRLKQFATTTAGMAFITGMEHGQREIFSVHCNLQGGQTADVIKCLLAWIYHGDIKKIRVTINSPSVMVTKTDGALIPYDPVGGAYPFQPIMTTTGRNNANRPSQDLVRDINLNGARGFLGPGTFPCREPHCTRGPLMTQAAEVHWGPGLNQVVYLRKRFYCNSNNLTYLIHCQACFDLDLWSTYSGESDCTSTNIHSRISSHLNGLASQPNDRLYPDRAQLNARITAIMGEPPGPDRDLEGIMQDPYSHFTAVHRPEDRRYTFTDGGFRNTTQRRGVEYLNMVQFGNFAYFPDNFSGSLNHETD